MKDPQNVALGIAIVMLVGMTVHTARLALHASGRTSRSLGNPSARWPAAGRPVLDPALRSGLLCVSAPPAGAPQGPGHRGQTPAWGRRPATPRHRGELDVA